MSAVVIKKVESKRDLKRFINLHYDLYKGNPYDAPNLFVDEMNTLRKDKNVAFEFCEAEYFLAYKDDQLVGRVAAIINHKANEKWQRRSVRFGWIDFIDDLEVSKALLKAVEDYGRKKGMDEVIGPLGFTDMDPEGMLTHGYEELGTMATIYNYDYYPRHMEQMGCWTKDNDYVEYKLFVPKEGMPEKYRKISELIMDRYNIHIKKVKRNEVFGPEGYGKKLFDIINETFKDLYGYSEISDKQIQQYVKMYFSVLDLNLITFLEDWTTEEHKVIGVGITIPSLSRALQKCHRGRFLPFGWWYLFKALKLRKTKYVDLLLLGVLPEYRKKGVNALLFYDLIPRYQKYGFEWGETQVEMETNEKVQSQWQYLQFEQHKRRRCYMKPIEETQI
ncbi:MAG: N-acetyltransferase [Prevotella sp.]|nr:N-acetyltransferase [Prevotella sp.]